MKMNKGIVLITVAAVTLGSANVAQAHPHFGHHGGVALAAGLVSGLVTGTILSHAAAAPVVYNTAPTVYTTPAPTVYTAPAQVVTTPAPVVYSAPTYTTTYTTPVVYDYGYIAPVVSSSGYCGGYYGYGYSRPYCPPPIRHHPGPAFHGGPIHRGPAPCAPRMGHPGGGFHGGPRGGGSRPGGLCGR